MGRLRDAAIDITPLRVSREFRLLWSGLAVSSLGNRIAFVALPIQVYDLTGSTLAVGLLELAFLVPLFTLSIVGGALADRIDRRRLIVGSELAGVATAGVLAFNASLPDPQLWVVYVFGTATMSVFALAAPAQRSSVPLLVERKHVTAALTLKSVTGSASFVIGPALAGILVATVGFGATYIADAATYLIGAAVVSRMRPIAPVGDGGAPGFRSVVQGLRYVRTQHALVGSFAADLNAMVFGMPSALFPAVGAERFPDQEWAIGLLYAAPFVGSFLASSLSGWTRRVTRHGRVVIGGVAVWGTAIAGFGLVDAMVPSLILLAVAGAADMVSGVSRQAMLQLASPPEMLGRMEGVGMAVWTSGPALGNAEAGIVAHATTVNTAIVSGGVLCVVGIGVLAALLPGFRRFDAGLGGPSPPGDQGASDPQASTSASSPNTSSP